tara:strand:- start:102 stop:689 length:588 start_codon:yes stop_codon:yes gene_type:complete
MGFVRKITGQDAAKRSANAAVSAGEIQQQAATDASALYDPFQQLGQSGLDQSSFLTDPNAQFDFLQNNPLFQMGLDNANEQTLKSAASRGRLSAGDTMQQLSQNALLAASPLINQQKQSIGDLLTVGQNVAGNQGNLLTGGAASQAAGLVGGANARNQGDANLGNMVFGLGGAALGATVGGNTIGGKLAGSLFGG